MRSWLAQRLAVSFCAFMGVFILLFCLMRFLPGDPFLSEKDLPKQSYLDMRKHWKLDAPWYTQFSDNFTGMLRLDFGRSIAYPDKYVKEIISRAFPVSLQLGLFSITLAIIIGIGSSVSAFLFKNGNVWYPFATTLAISLPSMLIGALLQYFFAIELEWFSVARWGSWEQMILPGITLAVCPGAFLGKLLYTRMKAEYKEPYARFAIAKGLSKGTILYRHILRNASPPALAYLGPLTANIATGTFVVEKIFAIPGLGMWFVQSISARDYPVITGLVLFYSLFLLFCVFLSDLAAMWADPRQREMVFVEAPT